MRRPALPACLLSLALAAMSSPGAARAQPVNKANDTTPLLPPVQVKGKRSQDEAGHDQVYEKNISNYYVDREYLDRYRGVSVGDVFSGINGVYNSDNRNGAALFPNIRGLSGNGRIPVTVDGTIQSIDVWMGMQGINNRNYVDPNMFRSIMVEKGPSMTRGLKSGIGGAVQIRTIEADDILQPGRSWGMQFKAGTSSNSISPSLDAESLVGVDYRTIPGARTVGPYGIHSVNFYEPITQRRSRDDTRLFNLDDRRVFLAGAFRHEYFDFLAAYSHSQRGNYFAGSRGSEAYGNNGYEQQNVWDGISSVQNLYPNISRLYAPKGEVPFTSTKLESVLLKNNWYLPNGHTVRLSFSRNNLAFHELPVMLTTLHLSQTDADTDYDVSSSTALEYPYPLTRSRNDTWRLNWQWQPSGSRWIDMDMSLWRTISKNHRYQNGDPTFQMLERDDTWDRWTDCNYETGLGAPSLCSGITGTPAPAKSPNHGQYSLFIGNEIQAVSKRTGVDFNNRMTLRDNLTLTVAADWQFEREEDVVPVKTTVLGLGSAPSMYGPRSGRREEYGASLNLAWQPVSRLQLSAGMRYGGYKSFDTEFYRYRRDRDLVWKSYGTITHQKVVQQRLMTDAEASMVQAVASTGQGYQELQDYQAANNITSYYRDAKTGLMYWSTYAAVPIVDGKTDSTQNPFLNGTLDVYETVQNPQGVEGEYLVYQPIAQPEVGSSGYITTDADDPYRLPQEQRESAWSFMFESAYHLTDHARVYARYSNMTRFPSLLESANTIGYAGVNRNFSLKPERNHAWEVGYTHNLAGLLPGMETADIKLSYFHNTIRNFYDRTTGLSTIQFDRKVLSGLEFQSRLDTGTHYANLSATYRLRQDMCDADYAAELDPHYGRMPECMPGGFFGTLSFLGLQPQYSINLDIGTRLLQKKLHVGARWRYHSESRNKTLDRILRDGKASQYAYPIFSGQNRPYYWDAVQLIDLYAEWHFTPQAVARLSVENLMDRYYLDPLTRVPSPGPGRTILLDLSFTF